MRAHALFLQEIRQDAAVRGGDAFARERGGLGIGHAFRHRQAQAAFTETQRLGNGHLRAGFLQRIQAHDPGIGHTVGHIGRNVVVAQEVEFHREVEGLCLQRGFATAELDIALLQQRVRAVEQAAGFLDGKAQDVGQGGAPLNREWL